MAPPLKKKSFIWSHFNIFDTAGTRATCNHCNKTLAYSASTMSNLNRHIRRAHPEVPTDDPPLEVFTVQEVEEVGVSEEPKLETFEIAMRNYEDSETEIATTEKEDPNWIAGEEHCKSEVSEAGPSKPKIQRKFTRRSKVWDHFEKSACKSAGQCHYCGKLIKLGTISNLTRHLRHKHPSLPSLPQNHDQQSDVKSVMDDFSEHEMFRSGTGTYTEVIEVNVDDLDNPVNIIETKMNVNKRTVPDPSEMDFGDELEEITPSQASQTEFLEEGEDFDINDYIRPKKIAVVAEQLDRQLVQMIVKGCHPFNMVDQPDFREFVSLLNPKYVLPTANKIALELIPEYYRVCEKRTTKSLQAAEGVVLFIDQWKSKSNSYMCISAHIINTECTFEAFFLSCHVLVSTEEATEISERLIESAKDWEITEKIVAVVTDNSNTIANAVLMCDWPHIPHFMKTLSLVINEGLLSIKNIVNKVRAIIDKLTKVPDLLAKVYSTQRSLMMPQAKLIKKIIKTDWSSCFMVIEMLTRFETLKSAIMHVLRDQPEFYPKLAETEVRNLTSCVEVLKVFQAVRKEIIQEDRICMSKVVYFINTIREKMKTFQNSAMYSSDATYVATIMITNLNKHFKDLEQNDLISNIILLDPRLKRFAFHDEVEFASACSKLKREVCEVVLPEVRYPEPNPDSLWNSFDTEVKKLNAVNDPIGKGILELENYLQEPLQNRHENPLLWWKQRRAIYPRLFTLAKKYLCLTAKSNPRESISYKTAYMLSHIKYGQSCPTESEVMFLHHNM